MYLNYNVIDGQGSNLVDIRDVMFTRASNNDATLPPAKSTPITQILNFQDDCRI